MRRETHLAPRPANFRPLTPLDFLARSAVVHRERTAVVWRDRRWSYGGFAGIVAAMAEALRDRGVGPGDAVSILCANRPELLAAHFGVPMLGATLNAINIRLDQGTVAYILRHCGARLLLGDPRHLALARAAAEEARVPLVPLADAPGEDGLWLLDATPAPLPDLAAAVPDEWHPIAVNYTSGTTGRPKGVVLSHRGAYLNALGNVLALGLDERSRYLWTLPMFHCNGWCHTWAVTAAGGTHVCLDRVDPPAVFDLIARHGVTHMACAPVVLYMLMNDPARLARDPSARVTVATGGAAPTSALIAALDRLGFDFLHLYGLTESYGPATLRTLSEADAALGPEDRSALLARQGVRHITGSRIRVLDDAGRDVPPDGESAGEIVLSGNTLLSGYYGDPEATEAAFAGDVFHTGDLAVVHPSGEIEIRDRAKDVIISGGENISSLEVEGVLHRHPDVLLAAVVARPHPKWGETPCAFLELKPGARLDPPAMREFCRDRLAHYKVPTSFVERELPRTATGKIQKFVLRSLARALAEEEEERSSAATDRPA